MFFNCSSICTFWGKSVWQLGNLIPEIWAWLIILWINIILVILLVHACLLGGTTFKLPCMCLLFPLLIFTHLLSIVIITLWLDLMIHGHHPHSRTKINWNFFFNVGKSNKKNHLILLYIYIIINLFINYIKNCI